MELFSIFSALLFGTIWHTAWARDSPGTRSSDDQCVSFGVDIQDEGSYFQNISSTDQFSFVSIFEGCQHDQANNILVDPNGDEYLCSDTSLQPDDTPEMSTCPIEKCQMWSGDWTIVILSNNGDADPVAYERDFYLTVGTPVTQTVTPTAWITVTTTPVINVTTTSWSTSTIVATSTVTVPSVTKTPTKTITPSPITKTTTITIGTISKTAYRVSPVISTTTRVQTCSVPPRQAHHDPKLTFTPTLVHAAALQSTTSTSLSPSSTSQSTTRRRAADKLRRVYGGREQRVAERKARLHANGWLEKRGLDQATTTVTDLNTADWPTSTSSVIAATSTMLITAQATTSITSTTTLTTSKGTVTMSTITITAPTSTRTRIVPTVCTTTVTTITKMPTMTITIATAPASSTAICRAKGGKLV